MRSRAAHLACLLVVGMASVPHGALGETRSKPQAEQVALVVSCGDLRREVAAEHPECQPRRASVAQRIKAGVDSNAPDQPRRIKALPWLIGVYN